MIERSLTCSTFYYHQSKEAQNGGNCRYLPIELLLDLLSGHIDQQLLQDLFYLDNFQAHRFTHKNRGNCKFSTFLLATEF